MSKVEIERRLASLETELAALKKTLVTPWWHDAVGAFENDPLFEKAMKIGKQYRKSQTTGQKTKKK